MDCVRNKKACTYRRQVQAMVGLDRIIDRRQLVLLQGLEPLLRELVLLLRELVLLLLGQELLPREQRKPLPQLVLALPLQVICRKQRKTAIRGVIGW